jgi:hypothetical protein
VLCHRDTTRALTVGQKKDDAIALGCVRILCFRRSGRLRLRRMDAMLSGEPHGNLNGKAIRTTGHFKEEA